MADDITDVGKSDRIRASLQEHEVRLIAKKFGPPTEAAYSA